MLKAKPRRQGQCVLRTVGFVRPFLSRAERTALQALREGFRVIMFQEDQTLTCRDCGQHFTFTAGEQRFFAERGFSQPARCPDCRAARKRERSGDSLASPVREARGIGATSSRSRGERVLYDTICDECGQPAKVPFRPRGDRAVYCRDCYQRRR